MGRRDWVATVGVEWAERSEPADTHAENASVVLTDPERRMAEYRRYLAIVHLASGTARGTDPPGTVNLPDADDTARPNAQDAPASTWAEEEARIRRDITGGR